MEGKTCCVTGHREIPEDKLAYVEAELRKAIMAAKDSGYTRFINGGAAGADLLFAAVVIELREQGCPISLEATLPYRGRLNSRDKELDTNMEDQTMLTFEQMLDGFKDYLAQDEMYEVIMTPHGYAVLEWDFRCEDWTDIKRCATPEIMLEILLDKYTCYLEYQAADGNGNIPDHAKAEIEGQRQALMEKFR